MLRIGGNYTFLRVLSSSRRREGLFLTSENGNISQKPGINVQKVPINQEVRRDSPKEVRNGTFSSLSRNITVLSRNVRSLLVFTWVSARECDTFLIKTSGKDGNNCPEQSSTIGDLPRIINILSLS